MSDGRTIKRQWHIIDFLLKNSSYVSTNDICQYLKGLGIDGQIRTVQRDLVKLQDVFGLECRTDDKPYSWRWQRLADSNKHQLGLDKALLLTMVERELKGLIPSEVFDCLEPLLKQARYKVATEQSRGVRDKVSVEQLQSEQSSQMERLQALLDNADKTTYGAVPSSLPSPSINPLTKLQALLKQRKSKKTEQEADKKAMNLLKRCLIDLGYDGVAGFLG